jgi:Tfp pilus assembly protein PilO
MKTSSKRILFIFLTLVFLIASVVVYSSYISSAYSSVLSLRGELVSKQDTYNQLNDTFTQTQSLFADFQNKADVQKQASLILPKDRNVSYLVGQIVGLADANGLVVSSIATQVLPIQPSASKVIRNIGRIKADVKISGSYAGFKSFIRQVENNLLILDDTDLSIQNSGQATSTSAGLSYSLSITSYYQTSQ